MEIGVNKDIVYELWITSYPKSNFDIWLILNKYDWKRYEDEYTRPECNTSPLRYFLSKLDTAQLNRLYNDIIIYYKNLKS